MQAAFEGGSRDPGEPALHPGEFALDPGEFALDPGAHARMTRTGGRERKGRDAAAFGRRKRHVSRVHKGSLIRKFNSVSGVDVH